MKKMTEAEWWQQPASAAACKILEMPEGTSQFECFMRALERITELEIENAKGTKEVPYVVKEMYGNQTEVEMLRESNASLFEKLLGTPEEQAAERKLRELAYTIVARTATREELTCLLEAHIIRELERGAIVVPELRLLQ